MPVPVFVAAVVALLVFLVLRAAFEPITVFEFQRGLRYRKGKLQRILEPGRHWFFRPHTFVQKVDIRPLSVTLPGQEVLSADGVTLKVSLAAEYRIADPKIALTETQSYAEALYLELQFALREIVGGSPIDTVLEERAAIGPQILAR